VIFDAISASQSPLVKDVNYCLNYINYRHCESLFLPITVDQFHSMPPELFVDRREKPSVSRSRI
jgi:hypothetical protein